ncbi:aldo/keto reductase, partial [Enterobacter sp. 56-7]
QSEYSIFAHDAEPVLPVIEELGIGLVAYSPLARGFLAAPPKPRTEYAADDFRQYLGWWAPANFDANAALSNELRAFAAEKGTTLSKLALAWLLAKRDYIVPIPGSRNPARVADNIAASDLHLSTTDLARIDAIAPNGAVGSRNYG